MAELITGHSGNDHISSDDFRRMLRGITGPVNCAADNYSISSLSLNMKCPAMEIYWLDSDGVGFCRTDGTENITVASTSQGMYRCDLVCLKYTLSGTVENVTVEVLQGTAGTSNKPVVPTFTNSSTVKYLPLFKVIIYQSTVQSSTFMLEKMVPLNGKLGVNDKVQNAVTCSNVIDRTGGTEPLLAYVLAMDVSGTSKKITQIHKAVHLVADAKSYASYKWTFEKAFSSAPIVQATCNTGSKDRTASVTNVTKTGCTVYFFNDSSGNNENLIYLSAIGV